MAEGLSSDFPSRHLNKTSRSAGLRFPGISGGDSAQAICMRTKAKCTVLDKKHIYALKTFNGAILH